MSRIINLCQIRTGHVQENGNCQDCSVAALSGDKRRNLNSHHTVSYILRIHVIAIHNNIQCRVPFIGKIQDWILASKNGFCVSLLNRLIKDHRGHGTSEKVFFF